MSAESGSQEKHEAPAAPQFIVERTSQVVPSQQPAGQDGASQTQLPPSHRCPSLHCVPPPHEQAPVVGSQPSAFDGSHATHAAPWAPQASGLGGPWHVVPVQHPSQTPQLEHAPSHTSPEGHWAQVTPRVPQWATSVPGRHVAPSQQPAHDMGSQTHVPPAHR